MSTPISARIRTGVAVGALAVGVITMAAPMTAAAATADTVAGSCRSIPVDADPALRSDLARLDFGVDGSGVTVAVISDSFDNPQVPRPGSAADVAAGLLPGAGNPCGYTTGVQVFADRDDSSANNEGRAMLQLVHGIAPGAQLMFSSVDDEDPNSIAAGIDTLAAAGADVIVDDVGTGKETFFQQSVVGSAIVRATAGGAVYLSAAGNAGAAATEPRPGQQATEISGWDTTAYRPSACSPTIADAATALGLVGVVDCMDFDQGPTADTTLDYTVDSGGGEFIYLQWGEPAGSTSANFVPIALVDGVSRSVQRLPDGVPGYQVDMPAREDRGDLQIAVVRVSDPADPLTEITPPLALRMQGSMLLSAEYWRSSGDDAVGRSVYGHNGDPATISIAAAEAADPLIPQTYSSSGPVTYLFTPQGADATPFAAPRVSRRPDVMSVDAVRNSILGVPTADPGVYTFSGTSAAAPNAAAVVALALQADPSIDQERARELLRSTARVVTASHPGIPAEDVVGAGLIDAHAVVARVVAERPAIEPTARPTLASTGADVARPGLIALAGLLMGAALLGIRSGRRRRRA